MPSPLRDKNEGTYRGGKGRHLSPRLVQRRSPMVNRPLASLATTTAGSSSSSSSSSGFVKKTVLLVLVQSKRNNDGNFQKEAVAVFSCIVFCSSHQSSFSVLLFVSFSLPTPSRRTYQVHIQVYILRPGVTKEALFPLPTLRYAVF